MKGLFVTAPGKLAIMETPQPQPGPFDALVKTEACAICNSTDTKVIHAQFVSGTWPVLLGHETVGRIIAVGDKVTSFHIGDRVLRGTLSDSDIPFKGGRSCWGGFAEYTLVTDVWAKEGQPYNAFPHPQQIVPLTIDPVAATMLITLKENLSVLSHFDVAGKSLAIIGTGPVAQAMANFAPYLGASHITVIGRSVQWAEMFKELGADAYLTWDEVLDKSGELVLKQRFERVIEAVGNRQALSNAIKLAGKTGKVGIYGIPPEEEPYLEQDVKNPIVYTPKVAEAEVHEQMLSLIQQGKVHPEQWVSLSLPLAEFEMGFKKVWAKEANKVVLTF